MDILTLELLDVTVSQAVLELDHTLGEVSSALVVRTNLDEALRPNLLRVVERHGRTAQMRPGRAWVDLQVSAAPAPVPAPAPAPAPTPAQVPVPERPLPPGILLTRDRLGEAPTALGRRLLLGVLEALPEDTPQVVVALDALVLLSDPVSRQVLEGLQKGGVPVQVSRESLFVQGEDAQGFEEIHDRAWQMALAQGSLRLLV